MRLDLNACTKKRIPCSSSKTRTYTLHMSYEDNRRFSRWTPHTSHSDMIQYKESWVGCSDNFQSRFRTSSSVEYYRTTLVHRGRSEEGLGTSSVVRQSRTRSKGNLVWDIALHRLCFGSRRSDPLSVLDQAVLDIVTTRFVRFGALEVASAWECLGVEFACSCWDSESTLVWRCGSIQVVAESSCGDSRCKF